LLPTFRATRTQRRNSIINFSLAILPNLLLEFRANRTKWRNSITNFPFTTLPQFHFVARLNVGRVYSRSHDAVIRVYDVAGNVIQTHEHKGDFMEP